MPVTRAVLVQSIPAIVAQLITLLYNWADTFFLARLNKPELVAAATIVLPLYLMLTAIGNLPGVGGGSQFSNHLGKHEVHDDGYAAYGNHPVRIFPGGSKGAFVGTDETQ